MQLNFRYRFASGPEVGRFEPADTAPGDWTSLAACAGGDPEVMFVEGAAQHVAARVCMGCPVRLECLVEALDGRIEHGVWGGLTERQRRMLLRRRPDVSSWREWLETTLPVPERAEHEGLVQHARTVPAAAGRLAAVGGEVR